MSETLACRAGHWFDIRLRGETCPVPQHSFIEHDMPLVKRVLSLQHAFIEHGMPFTKHHKGMMLTTTQTATTCVRYSVCYHGE